MKFVVTSRELKWGSDRLFRGDRFEAKTERDEKNAGLLVKIGRAEPAPDPKPVRRVASTVPPHPELEPQTAPEPTPEAPEEDTPDVPAPGRYRTRRLRSED